MPLAEEIDAFADSFWGGYRRSLYRLAGHLRQGVLLSDALEIYPRLVPRSVVVSIRAGEETGSPGRVLRQSAVGLTSAMQRTHLDGSLVSLTLYYWWVLTAYSLVLGFICYWIVPKFKEIFNDFGVELPRPTVTLIGLTDLFAANFWLLIPVIGLPLSLILLLTYIHLVGWGNLNWPWLLRWFPRRDAPEVLHNLALAVSTQHSLPETLQAMGGRHYRRDLGEKLQRIGAAIDGGEDGWQALRDEGFVSRTEAEAVAAAARAGHLAFALDALALSMERLRRHRMLWWIEACKPVIVIAMALLVASFCIAMFLPLVRLITQI
jgi:type IV pilus assembly protein PilC